MAMTEPVTKADSTTRAAPLNTLSAMLGGPRVDSLLSRAAARHPGKPALRGATGDIGYAELDARVSACAAALRELVGGPDEVIGIAAVLDPVFAVGYFGITRSRNVAAVVNPLLTEERLLHVLGTSACRALIVSPGLYPALAAIRNRLPELRHVVLTERAESLDESADAVPTLAELMAAAPEFTEDPEQGTDAQEAERIAGLHFTSGTTGAAKAVRLSHSNLTVNAAQSAYGHRVTESSVLFNYLPTFHLMHLTIGVCAGATHVLWSGTDIAGSVTAAARYGATHFYSLPMRLTRLAADPGLNELEAPRLRAILSGGSALPPTSASALSQHFGIPVLQGYGLTETSPSTHFDDFDRPKAGSSGVLVPGTEVRIVDVDTREVLPVDAKGEIQVRGPQLMRGYLGRDLSRDVDAEGWFSTGDVGRVDAEGYLFVVERIKDTFKCDNWLVSPSEIERVLFRHPAVDDCVVVDMPDPVSGAVAHALVVAGPGGAEPAELAEFVNAKLPYYEHLRQVHLVEGIPRSNTGKVQRRDLREELLRRTAE
ncbi:class I adenylate-forming enzyme family protein [Streptomyces sp. SUK 48]|uniref:class I adenylate-forming enzyme family protein n=1 Tax=Streptomyces sp. SUK 48 TaxID=2582831 RepID=UPI00129BC247|nr:class I adenylate-forming enzyme family protein [Streptomyces sp. SUK 48]